MPAEKEYSRLHSTIRVVRRLIYSGCCDDDTRDAPPDAASAREGKTVSVDDMAALLCLPAERVVEGYEAALAALGTAAVLAEPIRAAHVAAGGSHDAAARRLQALAVWGTDDDSAASGSEHEVAYAALFKPVRDFRVVVKQALPCSSNAFLRMLTNQVHPLDVDLSATVADVKSKVQEVVGLVPEQQTLIYRTKRMAADKTLADYHFRAGGMIYLMVAMSCD